MDNRRFTPELLVFTTNAKDPKDEGEMKKPEAVYPAPIWCILLVWQLRNQSYAKA